MLKIRSKIDVITNSSTEVFLLKKNGKFLEEVTKDLETFLTGALPPEVMSMRKGVLKATMDHGWYLFDPSSKKSMRNYWKFELARGKQLPPSSVSRKERAGFEERLRVRKELFNRWVEFLSEPKNWKLVFKTEVQNDPDYGELADREYKCENALWCYNVPDRLFDKFQKKNEELFNKIPLPDDMNARKFVGKIGIISESDNTISYECIEEIYKRYPDVVQYHLG